jgi:hypothetical protein
VLGNVSVRGQVFPDANGQVTQILPDGNGGFFICGAFSVLTEKPAGVPINRAGIAHIFADGRVDRVWNPNVQSCYGASCSGGSVYGIAIDNGALFLVGSFTLINGVPRNGLASIDAATGALRPWNPNAGITISGEMFGFGQRAIGTSDNRIFTPAFITLGIIDALPPGNILKSVATFGVNTIVASNGVVYIGGKFQKIGGVFRDKIAAIDAITGEVLPFQGPNTFWDGEIWSLAIAGNRLYLGGFFRLPSNVYRQSNIGVIDATTGVEIPWNGWVNSTVLAVTIQNNIIYAGGVFTQANTEPRSSVAAFEAQSGNLLSFAPTIANTTAQNPIVSTIQGQNDIVIIGGVFNMVNNTPASNLYATGSASVVAPAQPATNILAQNPLPNGTGFTLSWTPPASGALGYTVVAIEGTTAPTGLPQNGETYTGNAAFTGAATVPFSGQVVFDGAGTNVNITGLVPNTNYTFVVYPYNGSGIARLYGTLTPATATLRTNPPPPPPVVVHPGILTVSSATLSFGDVALGSSRVRAYTMHCYNLTVASVTITPPQQCEISVGGAPFTSAPFVFATRANVDQVQIRARFTPSANGALTGSITHIAGSTGAIATLSGQSSPPSISTSTLSLNFGAVVPSSSATLAYRLNYRNLTDRTITLTPSAGYAVSTTGTEPFSSVPLAVATGISGRFNVFVKFAPTVAGVLDGSVKNINTSVQSSPEILTNGRAEYPLPGVSVSRLNFGNVPVGSCEVLSYTVFPVGGIRDQTTVICPEPLGGDVSISTVGPSGPFSTNCEAIVFSRASGISSARVWVRYCPTTTNRMDIVLNHLAEPGRQSINLPVMGQGVGPEITVSPTSRNFGTNPLNSVDMTTLTVQVRNLTAPATILLSTTGNQAFSFLDNSTGQWNSTWTTAANVTAATYRVQARFIPTAQQTYRTTFAAVCVAQNGTTTDTFTLIGTGRGAALIITTGTLNFNGNFLLTSNTRFYVLRYDNITTATLDISPTNHPAFLLSNAQNGVFTTTAGLTYTVGGTAANPVSGNVTAWVRFLPDRAGTTTATLFHNSFVSVGTTGANVETLRLSGQGLAPFVNVSQGTVRFDRIPLGQTRYQQYTLVYRNITAASLTVSLPAGSPFDIADPAQTVTTAMASVWTSAGQTLTIPTIAATTATTLVPLWIRFTPTLAQNTTIAVPHTSNGGDPRTTDTDNLSVVITRPSIILDVVPDLLSFGTVAVNGSSTSTYALRYQNIGAPVTLTLPNGIGARVLGTTMYQTSTLTFTPPVFTGTVIFELQYQPTAAGNLTGNIVHTGGGTSATLQVRGRATSNLIFIATPNPISFTAVTSGNTLVGTIGQTNYLFDLGNAPSRFVNVRSLTPGVQISISVGDYAFFGGGGQAFADKHELTTIVAGRLLTMPITIRAAYAGSPTRTATIRHEILDAVTRLPIQTLDVPVTVKFISCPGRVDTISVMVLYTEGARDYLARRLQNISKIIDNCVQNSPRVFTNSRLNNLVVNVVNPDGEFTPTSEWTITGTEPDIVNTLNDLCSRPGNRLFTLREKLKADVVCVFNYREGIRDPMLNERTDNYTKWTPLVPNRNESVFAVSVETIGNEGFVPPLPFATFAEAIPYTVLHEMGHLCGGGHNPEAAATTGSSSPFIDGFGLESIGSRRVFIGAAPQTFYSGTIMYNGRGSGAGNGERLPFWSDPATQTNINNETLVNGVLTTTATTVVLGSATQNMRRVMSINGPKMASLYVSSLNPILAAPQSVRAGQTARIDVTTCEGVEPFMFVWTAQAVIGGAIVSGTVSNSGQTFEFVMPSGAFAVRVVLRLRDAAGIESVIERLIRETPALVLAEMKSEASIQSSTEQENGEERNMAQTAALTFALEQNRPNPCTDETQISLTLPRSEHVRLSLFDALGREVLIAFDDRLRAGQHGLVLDVRHLPSGMYTYRLQAGSYRAAKRMTILR